MYEIDNNNKSLKMEEKKYLLSVYRENLDNLNRSIKL